MLNHSVVCFMPKPSSRKYLCKLCLVLLLSALSLHSYGQFDSNGLSSGLGTETSSSPFAAAEEQEEFLPVNQAYQLEVLLKENKIAFSWVIADKYFLYGEQFRATANGQELILTIPPGKTLYDPIFEKDVEKHYSYVEVSFDKGQLPQGEAVELAITSQGCADAGLCYPPNTINYTLDANHQTVTQAVSSKTGPGSAATGGSDSSALASQGSPQQVPHFTIALTMIGFALVGGLILNLMPCVLPVLSLKALSLAKNQDIQSQRAHGWSYTLGVVSSFVAVAVILLAIRAAGQAIGWGFQLQSPWFVTLLIYLFFVMGLALSGYINLGSQWMNAGQNLTQGHGLKQSYFTGVLAVVVASPCSAPLMGSALGYALAQPWWVSLSIFIALGFGMALPFLLLSYSPKLNHFLPKPGAWMETFKQFLAFPLYLTALWLLWLLGRQLGNSAVILVLVGMVAMVFFYWLSTHSRKMQPLAGISVLILALVFSWFSSLQPTVEKQALASSAWEPYSESRLAELRAANQAVFINATADWCITCKANEKLVLTEATLEKMKAKGIHLLMADWTNYNPGITQLLETYRRGGVPLYVFFPAEQSAKAQVLPQILTPGSFNEVIENI